MRAFMPTTEEADVDRALAQPAAQLPRAGDFLLYPPTIQPWGYCIVDRLFAHRVVPHGTPRP